MTTRCSVDGCPTRAPDFQGDPEEWHRCWAKAIKGHKCWGPLDHQHWPRKGMGGNRPESKIVACLCQGMHDQIDNGFKYGNAVVDAPEGKVYTIWRVKDRKNLLWRVIEPAVLTEAEAPALAKVWDNESDAVFDEPPPDEPHEALPAVDSARGMLAAAGDKGRQALELAGSVPEVKEIRDKAEALGTYAKAAHLGLQAQNEMADIKIRAERKAGQLLSTIERAPGRRYGTSLQAAIRSAGIGETMAHRWQLEAEIPDLEYEAYAQTCNQESVELTSAGILRLVRALKHEEKPPETCPESATGHSWKCEHCGKGR